MIFANLLSERFQPFQTPTFSTRFVTSLPESVFTKETKRITHTPFSFAPGEYDITLIDFTLLSTASTINPAFTALTILGYFDEVFYSNSVISSDDIKNLNENYPKVYFLLYTFSPTVIIAGNILTRVEEGFVSLQPRQSTFPFLFSEFAAQGECLVFPFCPVWIKQTLTNDPLRFGVSNTTTLLQKRVIFPSNLNYLIFLHTYNETIFQGQMNLFFEAKKIA